MEKLTHEDAEWLWHRLGPTMRFFHDLRGRLEKRGHKQEHSLYRQVCACYDAIFFLRVTAQYGSCESGVFGAAKDSFGPGDDAEPSQDPSSPQT